MSQLPHADCRKLAEENLERYLVPAIFRPWAAELVEHAKLISGEQVLDLACGSGIVARLASERVGANGKVVGLDNSDAALEVAQKVMAELLIKIDWQNGDAIRLPFSDAEFDLVLCQQGLQFFNRQVALREIRRVLKSGGRLTLSVWSSIQDNPGYDALQKAVAEHVDDSIARGMMRGFSLDNAEHLHTLLTEAGFRDVTVIPVNKTLRFASVEDFVLQWMACSVRMCESPNVTAEKRRRLIDTVTLALQRFQEADSLAFPMKANVANAYI